MVTSFLLCLMLLLLGPACVVLVLFRDRVFFAFPVVLVTHWGITAILYALTTQISFGLGKTLLVYLASALVTYFLFRRISFPKRKTLSGKKLFLLALVMFLVALDLAAVLLASGWDFQKSDLFWKGISYFRPPFLHDIQRDVVLVKSILRHSSFSPYLPHSGFAYQLLWYQWAAVPLFFFKGMTHYPYVCGSILASAFVFLFVMAWSLAVIRPSLSLRTLPLLCLIGILFTHTDIYNGLRALFSTGQWGIETDLPAGMPIFFRFGSLKSLALIAPQHGFFLAFFLVYFTLSKIRFPSATNKEGVLFGLSLVAFCLSPIMAGMIFPLFLLRIRGKWKESFFRLAGFLGLGSLLFLVTHGFSPLVLLTRPNGPQIFLPADAWGWIPFFPLLWWAALGVPGVFYWVTLFFRFKQHHWKRVFSSESILILIGLPVFYYLYSHSEIRRYFTLLSTVLVALVIVRNLPAYRICFSTPLRRFTCLGAVGVALLFHGVFLGSYLARPSTLSPFAQWKDYFKMNQVIETQFPGIPVMAARDISLGLEKPIALEATTSFAAPVEVAIHTQLTPGQFAIIKEIHETGNPLRFAKALGYEAVVWGPVEERVWGPSAKQRFVEDQILAKTGTVTLLRLKGDTEAVKAVR